MFKQSKMAKNLKKFYDQKSLYTIDKIRRRRDNKEKQTILECWKEK